MLPFPAASRRALRLDLAASSGTPLALRATACSAPLSPPERTRRAARHVTPHHIASELLDRNNLRMDLLVRIDQRNPCTLSGVARRRVTRQGYPCVNVNRCELRVDDNKDSTSHWDEAGGSKIYSFFRLGAKRVVTFSWASRPSML